MAAVNSRYARAFADVVIDAKLDPNKVQEQIRSLVAVFQESPELQKVWESPAIPEEQKRKVLDAVAARLGITDRATRNFIAVLIDHSRIGQLPEIAKQFETEMNSRFGRIEAQIASARELSASEQQQLLAEIGRMTGKHVSPTYTLDPALLGGVVVKVGSTVYDGSVRGQLQRIKQQLANS